MDYLRRIVEAIEKLAGSVTGDKVRVDAVLEVGDVEIGAVELKDKSTDSRARVPLAMLGFLQNPQEALLVLPVGAKMEDQGWGSQTIGHGETHYGSAEQPYKFHTPCWDSAVVTIKAVYHGSATAGIEVFLDGCYITAGPVYNWDSEHYVEDMEPPFAAGGTKQISIPIDIGHQAFRVGVKNLDAVQDVTVTVVVTYKNGFEVPLTFPE